MRNLVYPLAAALLLATFQPAIAQSPGSIESELKYAREYLEAGKWDYAMWRYEGVLAREPNNAEARAGYERAKANLQGGQTRAAPAALPPSNAAPQVANPARPAAPPIAPPAPAPKTAGAPPVGSYFCTYGLNRGQVLGPGRNFQLMAGGRYAADDGAAGTYRYDANTRRITFSGGFFGRMNAYGEFKGGQSNQIDINPAGGVVSFCSRQ